MKILLENNKPEINKDSRKKTHYVHKVNVAMC